MSKKNKHKHKHPHQLNEESLKNVTGGGNYTTGTEKPAESELASEVWKEMVRRHKPRKKFLGIF